MQRDTVAGDDDDGSDVSEPTANASFVGKSFSFLFFNLKAPVLLCKRKGKGKNNNPLPFEVTRVIKREAIRRTTIL